MKTNRAFYIRLLLIVILYAAGFHLLLVATRQLKESVETPAQVQQAIASQVIRLHVIANSDSPTDQSLKLQVRDEIIGELQDSLKQATTVGQAQDIVQCQTVQLQQAARRALARRGCTAPVTVALEQTEFPVKTYGDLTFPAGRYQALCVRIGQAAGHNWWCVLFPSLCFVDETTAVVPQESKQSLKERLTDQEYDSLQVHSGIYDWLQRH